VDLPNQPSGRCFHFSSLTTKNISSNITLLWFSPAARPGCAAFRQRQTESSPCISVPRSVFSVQLPLHREPQRFHRESQRVLRASPCPSPCALCNSFFTENHREFSVHLRAPLRALRATPSSQRTTESSPCTPTLMDFGYLFPVPACPG